MIKLKILLCFVLTLHYHIISSQDLGEQPRIKVRNGHMILSAARDKNISLETSGLGGLHLNGEDLVHLLKTVKNATKNIDQFGNRFVLVDNNGVPKQAGISEILQRIDIVESSMQNFTKIVANRNMVYRVNTRLNSIQKNVRKIVDLLNYNECQTNPCTNGGTCQDLYNSYMCHCPDQWEGPTCNIDVDECLRYSGTDLGCQNGATCVNKRGGYECICTQGWVGIHCLRSTTDCNSGGSELCGHGTCVSQSNSFGYKCICDQGWKTDGTNPACAVDVDECTLKRLPCSTNPFVPCINVPGSFYCGSCPTGYTGNGYYCTDMDECTVFNGGCSMNPMVQCINTLGSRTCGSCPPGYLGNGLFCSYQGGVCAINNGGCHPVAQCRDNSQISLSHMECICPRGYMGNGIGPSGCIKSDYLDPCSSNPCMHGTCTVHNYTNNYVCDCGRKFTGKNCDIMKDPCSSNPCLNNGTCSQYFGFSYQCKCTDEYFGFNCENGKQVCGDTIEGFTGTFTYPVGGNRNYKNCIWKIKTNRQKVLQLVFVEVDLEDSEQCRGSSLQIRDSVSRVIRTICGKSSQNITTSTNEIQLWLKLSSTLYESKFVLYWSSIDPACGGTIYATSHGTIKSPNSPANYPSNRNCYWRLITVFNKRIVFHFYSLDIGNNNDCNKDYLEFYSDTIRLKPFAKYCRTSNPEPLQSETSSVIVHFHSDSADTYPGFQIAYSIISGIPGCGGTYTEDSGTIISPADLTLSVICDFKIKLRKHDKVKIEFSTFDVGKSGCDEAYVAMYEGPSEDALLIGQYCGSTIPAAYTSLTNEILISYKSGNSRGFAIKYSRVCREQLTNSRGTISSTNDILSRDNKTCVYEIIQPQGSAIHLTFAKFSLNSTDPRDYMEITDNRFEDGTYIGRYNNSNYPETIISKLNYLRITVLQMSSSIFEYTLLYRISDITCGGILTKKEEIRSPLYLESHSEKLNCTWFITAPKDHVIKLTWINFHVVSSPNCSDSYVAIYNEAGKNEGLLGKYCKSTVPPIMISSTNVMKIIFIKGPTSDRDADFDNFFATFSFIYAPAMCGGEYFSSGIIKTPVYTQNIREYIMCEWKIRAPPGMQIILNVTNTLRDGSDCDEYLAIRDGRWKTSHLIGFFCNHRKPSLITSNANNLYLVTRTNIANSIGNIIITWESASTGCGGILTSYKGEIVSPNYPEEFVQLAECYWKVIINAGSVLQFTFTDMDIPSSTCLDSYVEIFDGPVLTAPSLGKYCTSFYSVPIRSTQKNAMLKFVANGTAKGRGFHLEYVQVCNTTLKGHYGIIESPNFPNSYPADLNCSWNIHAPKGNKVNITFTDFNLVNKNNSSTFLEITYFDSSSNEFQSTGKYYDKNPLFLSINANDVRIHFISGNNFENSGFRLEWEIVGCVEKLTRQKGIIMSPNYPDAYPSSTGCEWLIQAGYGYRVVIEFEEIDIDSRGCFHDSIEVYNGPDTSYPLLSKLCKTDKSTTLTSSGNSLLVTFQSDSYMEGRGFKANYSFTSTTCGGYLRADSGSFYSPNYPKNFNLGDNCDWLIEVKENYAIDLNFTDVDLIKNCSSYYIQVYDGQSSNSSVLTTICDGNLPATIIKSTKNYLFVEMRSGQSGTSKGFRATFNTSCGAILTEESGLISFESNRLQITSDSCHWTIIAERPDEHVSFTLTALEDMSCNNVTNYLAVHNGYSSSSPLFGTYCRLIPPTITSSGSALHIIANYGFRASYRTISSGCGGTLENENGYFASPGYPNSYPVNSQCEWLISASGSITVSFSVLDLADSEHCNDDFLEFRERDRGGKLLGIFCGTKIPTNLTHIGPLLVFFKSSKPDMNIAVNTGRGFLAEYVLNHDTELASPSGQIFSPLYPHYFSKGIKYSWRVTVDFSHKISIEFIDMDFTYNVEQQCSSFTPLAIYDGYDETAPVLSSMCNSFAPKTYESSSNVVFITCCEYATNKLKFLLNWHQIKPVVPTSTSKPQVECNNPDVIDLTDAKNYTFTSPGYPNGYESGINCNWMFSTIPEQHLVLFFTNVDIYNYPDSCFVDPIYVYSRRNEKSDWYLQKTVCYLNETLEKIKVSNSLKVEFSTGYMGNQTGFAATVLTKCGGSIEKSNGVITVDNSTYGDGESITCEWNVTVRSGRMIEVKFRSFDIGENRHQNCRNYVLLRNGHYAESPFLGTGKYCGGQMPDVLRTSGFHLYVKFEARNKCNGFIMEYNEVSVDCKEKIALTNDNNSTVISSPNYPNIPTPHIECSWIITAPPGESLRVDFVDRFDITQDRNCVLEYVEIREGGTISSPLIGRWCEAVPSTQTSDDNVIFIKFFTDVQNPKNGFKAVVSIADCGGTLRGRLGELKSTTYVKQSIKKTADCTWNIIAPSGRTLTLVFTLLEFDHYNCENNYVEVIETYFNKTEKSLGRYCSVIPQEIVTAKNDVKIHYKSENIRATSFALKFLTKNILCGGFLENEVGFIQSPGYPLMPYNDKFCTWVIRVPQGRRIKVEVLDFDLDPTIPKQYQSIEFHSGENLFFGYILSLYAMDNVKFINSTGNTMTIFFILVQPPSHHRGFKLKYTSDEPTVCKGDFNQESGTLNVPGLSTYSCSWTRIKKPPANETLSITVYGKFDSNVRFDSYLRRSIVLTAGNKNKLLADMLSNLTNIRTPYLVTKLVISQSHRHEQQNLTAVYKTYPCGGIITESNGYISTSNFQKNMMYECVWIINPPEGQFVKVTFTFMDLGDDCSNNYIIIHNGLLRTDPVIGTYCSTNRPENLQSQSNSIWIESQFKTGNNRYGFNLTFESTSTVCGGILYDATQFIQTPLYPNNYPSNTECIWILDGMAGYHIGLEFIDRFHLETSDDCTNDFVEIWDYVENQWSSMNKLCGRDRPSVFNSTSNKMKIMFRSNGITSGNGFKARWQLNCGANLIAEDKIKYLSSPGYPVLYRNNMICVYNISARDQQINIVFLDFSLESSRLCQFDNLTISSNNFHFPMTTKTYCGNKSPRSFIVYETVNMTFRTDNSRATKGFKFSYNIYTCGKNITQPTVITSPPVLRKRMYDYEMMTCIWNITAPPDKIVTIRFESFLLQHDTNCATNRIGIFDGFNTTEENRLVLLCGNLTHNLPTIQSHGNTMTLIYGSYPPPPPSSFKAAVYFMYGPSAGCGGIINLGNKTSHTLDGPELLSSVDCHWQIQTKDGFTLTLKFLKTVTCIENNKKLHTAQGCACSFLEIRDGGGPFSEPIISICDNSPTSTYTTSSNQAWVRWFTNGNNRGKSFQLHISAVPTICGEIMLEATNTTKFLTSPNYPHEYPSNTKCSWSIKGSNYATVYLKFVQFDLGTEKSSKTCDKDRIDIADKTNMKVILEGLGSSTIYTSQGTVDLYDYYSPQIGIHQYCGLTATEFDYHSVSNDVVVTFYSGSGTHGKGFKLEYEATGCSKNMSSIQGRLISLNNYPYPTECIISIKSPENTTISLYFNTFYFPLDINSKCLPKNKLEIFDGDSTSSPLLASVCGYDAPNPVFSSQNKMFFHVVNDDATYVAYDITFTSSPEGDGCGGKIYNYRGVFTSPMYPNNYRKIKECVWEIYVPLNLDSAIKFKTFNLLSPCATDYVIVTTYDKDQANEHRYCANDVPPILHSSNRITVTYKTTLNNGGSGWVAQFTALTDGYVLKW